MSKIRLLLLCLSLLASIGINAKDKETKIAPGVWFEGAINAEGLPTGHGTLIVANAAKTKKATKTETITGDFEGNVVKNAELKSATLLYGGDLQWNFLPEENNLSVIEYHLTNGKLDIKEVNKTTIQITSQTYTISQTSDTRIKRMFNENGKFNYSLEGEIQKMHQQKMRMAKIPSKIQEYINRFMTPDDINSDEIKRKPQFVKSSCEQTDASTAYYAELKDAEQVDFPNFTLFYNNNDFQIIKANTDYIYVREYNRGQGITIKKTYPDGSGFYNVSIGGSYISFAPAMIHRDSRIRLRESINGDVAWIRNTDGTWATGGMSEPRGNLYIAGITDKLQLVEKIWSANTLPEMKLVKETYSKIDIYNLDKRIKTLDPKRIDNYDLSGPDFKKIDDELKAKKLKALAGTYTADDETRTGDQKLWYTVNLKADGTCTATIKWYAKLVNVNRYTGARITDVCNLTLQFNQGSKWFYDIEKDMYGIVLKLSEAVPNGTVVTNNAKKRTINTMEAIQVGQEFVKRVNDYLFEAKANNTKLKSTGTPFELTKKSGATSGSGNSTAKKPAGRR